MKKTLPYSTLRRQLLADRANAIAYLNAEIEEGDMRYLRKAIRNVVAANGGMGALAKATGLSRTSLYKTLSDTGNPEFSTLSEILAVYGIRLGVFPMTDYARRQAARQGHYSHHSHHPHP